MHAELTVEFTALGGIVPVITDELRIYHPDYTRVRSEHPEALIEHTDQAARWWQDNGRHPVTPHEIDVAATI